MNITGVILCGGQSTRMGFDKTQLKINNQYLIHHQIKSLSSFCKDVILVTDHRKRVAHIKAPVPVVEDAYFRIGPLGAIYTALQYAKAKIFVIGCDMPKIDHDFIQVLYKESNGMDCCIPTHNTYLEALYGIYDVTMIPYMKECILAQQYAVRNAIFKSHYGLVDVAAHGVTEELFMNFNYEKDVQQFLEM